MASSNTSAAPLVGVILAGGLSRRMFSDKAAGEAAGDKGLLPLGADTMLGRVVARLAPQVAQLVINANGDARRFAAFGLPVVADPIEGFVGPLAGVLAGLQWSAREVPGATHVITTSADAPFLPSDLADRLWQVARAKPGSIALARSSGELHPVIGCWPVAHAADLDAALRAGTRKVLHWTDSHGTLPVDFDFIDLGGEQVDPFFNANTPAELDEARRLIAKLSA